VPIPAGGRLARRARLVLYFDMRWIMISEIRFDTGQCFGVFVAARIVAIAVVDFAA
jgi:hypothetical protein